jgi:NTE family protein
MNIGLSLSGGGYRATVFHLGLLARLAESNALEQVTVVSTVSGGSLCAGMVLGLNQMRWPTSQEYIEHIASQAHDLLTTTDLQKDLISRALGSFGALFGTRADDLSHLIQEKWGIKARLNELPEKPRWLINATCYETGKNWRFQKYRMGDYLFGYSRDTDLPLADAMAASAGFPVGIGPLVLDATTRRWYKYAPGVEAPTLSESQVAAPNKIEIKPEYEKVHLWDGGAYDNHGLEGVHDFAEGWQLGIEFLIVSDAAGRAKPERYSWGPKAIARLMTGIMMDQIRSLRSRAIVERFKNHQDKGIFAQTGNTCERIIRSAGKGKGWTKEQIAAEIARICPGSLGEDEATKAAEMGTVIRKLTEQEYRRLFQHGFEVADGLLYAYYPQDFEYIGYTKSRWANA